MLHGDGGPFEGQQHSSLPSAERLTKLDDLRQAAIGAHTARRRRCRPPRPDRPRRGRGPLSPPGRAALRARPWPGTAGMGIWLASGHAEAGAVLRDRRLGRVFGPRTPDDDWDTFNWLHADSILDSEPPKHTRLRRLVAGAFGRGHVQRLAPRIEELAAGLLADLPGRRVRRHRALCRAVAGARDRRAARRPRGRSAPPAAVVARRSCGCTRWTAPKPTRRRRGEAAGRVRGLRRGARRAAREGARRRPPDRPRHRARRLGPAVGARARGHGGAAAQRRARGERQRLRQRPALVAHGTRPAARWTSATTAAVARMVEEFLRHDSPLHLFERTAKEPAEVAGVALAARRQGGGPARRGQP